MAWESHCITLPLVVYYVNLASHKLLLIIFAHSVILFILQQLVPKLNKPSL